jgi:DNA sulfur modification protein DndB
MGATGFSHSFPAVRGIQAGRPFFIAMCPLKVIPKIFVFDEAEVPPELRAQRTLNRARIPEIASYLLQNADSYVLSALVASVDANVSFTPHAEQGPAAALGMLSIPMEAKILINDGQHRRAAIEEAITENPSLGQDNVPVVFFADDGLKRSQQMFADLNRYAIRPSHSLGTLYDHRDPASGLARHLAQQCAVFKGLTEMERSTISNRSTKLFTLSSIKHASKALLRKQAKDPISESERKLACEYWDAVGAEIRDWARAKAREVSTAELRQNFVHSHGIALHALGIVGASLLSSEPKAWKTKLRGLRKLDWSRSNTDLWEGRAMIHGRISKASTNVQLTANAIKKVLSLRLSEEEKNIEESR